MMSLILAERYKLLHSRSAWAFFLGVVLVAVAMSIISGIMSADALGGDGIYIIEGMSSLLAVWLAAFVGFFAAAEFQSGAARNTISLGKSRAVMFFSKFFTFAAMTILTLFTLSLASTAILSIINGAGDMGFAELLGHFAFGLAMQAIFHLPYVAVFNMLAFITKNAGLTIILSIAYILSMLMAMQLLGMFEATQFLAEFFPEYYIMFFYSLSGQAGFIIQGAAVSAAFTVIACVIGCIVFKRMDMK